jgi:hypothetical protein
MEVDTNELLHRIGMVLRVISNKMDRLIEIGERVEGQVRLPSELEAKTFADAKEPAKEPPEKWRILEPGEVVYSGDRVKAKTNPPSDPPHGLGWRPVDASVGTSVCEDDPCIFARPVAAEPAKKPEPEHPAGPMPDPGEGYRILAKNPPEDLQPGDEYRCHFHREKQWVESTRAREGYLNQLNRLWYRRKIEPAKQPDPAWEPKAGDWVRVTRPDDWEGCRDPDWLPIMHEYHDKVMQVSSYENRRGAWCAKFDRVGWFFHRDWLTPSIQYFAEPPEIDKPLETEYQRPSLPKDAGKLCEFSDDGESWVKGYLKGFDCDKNWNEGIGWLCAQNFLADRAGHRFARIKKES